tara:strand:- start:831 stop:992 length:162 start_codon:yes stop_codon:yes gene_type:complete
MSNNKNNINSTFYGKSLYEYVENKNLFDNLNKKEKKTLRKICLLILAELENEN